MKKLICIILAIVCLISNTSGFYEGTLEDGEEEYYIETTGSLDVPNINARAAILYDVTFDRILYEKSAKEQRANASTTKMITAIVAYEEGNLDDIITISQNAANTGGSTINLRKDDRITLDDLIKGLLIHSGNDAAVAIAEYISGSVEEFANLMNEKLEEIGARDTHFVTPHGLDKDEHFSTAYDLMLIAKELLKIPYLADIVSRKSVEIKINDNIRMLGTTNEMLSTYDGADGIKTGYTGDAGRCIVTSAVRDGRRLISVVLGCDTKKNRTRDSANLLNYGFNAYKVIDFKDYIRQNICINVEKSDGKIYMLKQNVEFKYPLLEGEIDKVNVRYTIKPDLIAPLYKNEIMGTAEIFVAKDKIGEISYTLPENISKKGWKKYFFELIKSNMTEYLL